MNWRNHITQPIKLVIWDLDDTIWSGTLAESDDVRLYFHVKTALEGLTGRGIINAICSKDHMTVAKRKLQDYGLWEYFILSNIDFTPKGPRVAKMLNDLQLCASNALMIDDNAFELLEIQYFNKRINLLHASFMDNLLMNPFLQGSHDDKFIRYGQYKEPEKMAEPQKSFESNEEFLKSIHIRIAFIDCKPEYLDRIFELVSRTNQLNYTKNRMSKEEIKAMLSDDNVTAKCIQATDDIGEKGFVGFYAIKNNILIHFLFSCRVLNMGIEQKVYSYLNDPDLTIVGEVAVPLSKRTPCYDYIHITDPHNTASNESATSLLPKDYTKKAPLTTIYTLGACDVFNMIGNLAAPCNRIIVESNTYKGNYRSVNVGAEYIRSSYDMNSAEKEFCRAHFYNYSYEFIFEPQIFDKEYDYVLLSSYDDFQYRIWVKNDNSNIRVLRSHEPIFGEDAGILSRDEGEVWLAKHFQQPYFIDETRLYQNLQWIRDKLSPKTVLILLNGPEFNFYMLSNNPAERHNPELRDRIIRLNKAIKQFALDNNRNVRLVDVNQFLTRIIHFTNNIFHWTTQKCFEIAKECIKIMSQNDVRKAYDFLHKLPINNRKIVVFGVSQYAQICLYSLIANGTDVHAVCYHLPYTGDDFVAETAEILNGNKQLYYIVVIDEENYESIEVLLKHYGYTGYEDYIRLPSSTLLKTHTIVV